MRRYFGFLAHKNWILLLSIIALIGLTALAAGLRTFEFSPAQRLGADRSAAIRLSFDRVVGEVIEIPAWKLVVFWVLFFFIVLLISSLLSPEARKRLIRAFIRFASFLFIFLYVIHYNPNVLEILDIFQTQEGAPSASSEVEDLPPPVFQPPQLSLLVSYLISFGVVILCLGLIWGFNRWWRRRQAVFSSRRPLDELAAIARSSLDEVVGGKDWGDAIIRCYDRMSRVVDRKRGLQRASSMTPAEFAVRLEVAGLPREAVHRLTRLFESVRYGGRRAERGEIDEAAACLTSILQYCGEQV